MDTEIKIRMATKEDAPALLEIYTPYVLETAVTFEIDSAETSIYVRKDLRSRGLGRRMYEALAKLLLLQNVFNMEACIAHCDPADEYVPATSRLFHTRLGFEHAGRFNKCALKFGRWYDMIWMERILAKPAAQETSPFRPLPDIDQLYIDSILSRA